MVDLVVEGQAPASEFGRCHTNALGIDMRNEARARCAQRFVQVCLREQGGVVYDAHVSALGGDDLLELGERRAVLDHAPRPRLGLVVVKAPRELEQVAREHDRLMREVGGPLSLQGLDDLYDLEGIADVAPQRAVHIGDERLHAAPHALADLDHGLREFDGLGHGLHECAGSDLDVEQDAARTRGELLAHDRAGDKRYAAHGRGDVAQGIDELVGRDEVARLADDGGAVLPHAGEECVICEGGVESRDALELVHGAARVAKTAPGHLGNECVPGVHGRKHGHDGERGLIPNASSGVLVHGGARDAREVHDIARVHHVHGEQARLLGRHAA